MEQKKRLQAVVYGRVQGVSFRYYTRLEAQRLGIVGWVANQPDGTVRVVAEGAVPSLEAFTQYLQEGSPLAHVDRAEMAWEPATGEFDQFGVRWFNQ